MSINRRLHILEANLPPEPEEDRSEIRQRMTDYFDRIARLRREGRDPSEDPEHAAVHRMLSRRRAYRGEVRS